MAEKRWKVIEAVKNPLQFFALFVIVVEGVLALFAGLGLPEDKRWSAFLVLVGVMVLALVIVVILVVFWPKNLMGELESELERSRAVQEFIGGPGFEDVVAEIARKEIERLDSKNE